MSILYAVLSSAAVVSGGLTWLVRRYRKSLSKDAQTIGGYLWGNIRLRVGSVFSRVLARQLSARRYAELALKRTPSKVSIPSVQNFNIDIAQIYVRLSMASGVQRIVSDSDLLSGTNRNSILIFGEPGSGKSTLTKKVFRDACMWLFAYPAGAPLPVRIELRDLQWGEVDGGKADAGDWLLDQISSEIDSIKGMYSDGFVSQAFARGHGLLVFLDGLDEVSSDQLATCCTEITGAIKQLVGLGGSSQVVVTGRTQLRTVLPRRFLEGFDETFTIRPFSLADVFAFLRSWPFPEDGRSDQIARVFRAIQSNVSLQEMCTNPLVLSMYVARDQLYVLRSSGRPVRLPDTRTDFYQEIVNELLLFRRGEQLESAPTGSHVRQRRQDLLGRIALAHLEDREQPVNSISWSTSVEITKELFGLPTVSNAETTLRQMAIETGIFSEERMKESMRFLHLTLCEYLAAKELREADPEKLEEVIQTVIEDEVNSRSHRLLEVAIFAVSLVGRMHRNKILAQILGSDGAPQALFLRIIRDNYENSDEMLFVALERVAEALESADAPDVYLPDVHLLLQCFAKAQAQAAPGSRLNKLGARNVLRRMVDRGTTRFESIFSVCLAVDPKMAIQEAKSRKLASALLKVDTLVEALQDPEVVAYGLSRRNSEPELWSVALAEAALRYPLVAQILYEETTWTSVDARRRTEGDWRSIDLLRGTVYGEVLQFATSYFSKRSDTPSMFLSPLAHYGVDEITRAGFNSALRRVLNLESRTPFMTKSGDVFKRPAVLVFENRDGRYDLWGTSSFADRTSDLKKAVLRKRSIEDLDDDIRMSKAPHGIPLEYFILACYMRGCLTVVPNLTISSRDLDASGDKLVFPRQAWFVRIFGRRVSGGNRHNSQDIAL